MVSKSIATTIFVPSGMVSLSSPAGTRLSNASEVDGFRALSAAFARVLLR
jgi:hypothetical protein